MRSSRFLVALLAAVVGAGGLFLCCGGMGVFLWWRENIHPSDQKAESRSAARTEEEELVEKYVLEHANDPRSVAVVAWGPHSKRGELNFPFLENDELVRDFSIVRLRWREKNNQGVLQMHDALFMIRDDKVHPPLPNQDGDDWIVNIQDRIVQLSEGAESAKRLREWKPTPHESPRKKPKRRLAPPNK